MHHYGNWSTLCVDFSILELFHGSHFAQLLAHALKSIRTNAPSVTVFNFSRIDNIELVLEVQSALCNESYTVFVYSRSWNLMRYREGVAGAAFQ